MENKGGGGLEIGWIWWRFRVDLSNVKGFLALVLVVCFSRIEKWA
jgi:hypothetical protein